MRLTEELEAIDRVVVPFVEGPAALIADGIDDREGDRVFQPQESPGDDRAVCLN